MKQLLLSVFMLLAIASGYAQATSGTCGEDLTWTFSGGTLTISGTGTMTDYHSQNYPPWYSYSYEENITDVVIESGVESIGANAFINCRGLISVSIPSSVTSIGHYSFNGCSNMPFITIPDGVKIIRENAFAGCSKLTSITVPNSITDIRSGALRDCSSLASFIIPASLTRIEDWIFSGCRNLTSIIIPENITSIGTGAFSNCSSFVSIVIPSSVTKIGSGIFEGCSSLTSVTIPNTLSCIESRTFADCSNLTSIIIPNSVNEIGGSAFWGCNKLASITIPNNVSRIGGLTFGHCSSLTSITISNSVTSIDDNAFYYCPNLREIVNLSTTPPAVTGSTFNTVDVKSCSLKVPAGAEALYRNTDIWKDFSISVGGSFSLKAVSMDCLIGDIVGCETRFYAPGEVVTLEAIPFARTSSYFVNWTEDETVVSDAQSYTFSMNKDITLKANFLRDVEVHLDAPGTLPSKLITWVGIRKLKVSGPVNDDDFDTWNLNLEHLEELDFENAITETAIGSWNGCENLESLILPKTVKHIGRFALCIPSLKTLVLPDSLETIDDFSMELPNVKTIVFGNKLRSIGRCFNGLGVESITFPNSLRALDSYSFNECANLKEVKFDKNPAEIATWSFSGNPELVSIKLPDHIKILDGFSGSPKLTSIAVPTKVSIVGNAIFAGSETIQEIKILNLIPPEQGFRGTFNPFPDVNKNTCVLRVPSSSIEKYRSHYFWSSFKNLVGSGFSIYAEPNYIDIGDIDYDIEQRFYTTGETVNLTAKPFENAEFAHWIVNDSKFSTEKQIAYTITGDTKLLAVFASPATTKEEDYVIVSDTDPKFISNQSVGRNIKIDVVKDKLGGGITCIGFQGLTIGNQWEFPVESSWNGNAEEKAKQFVELDVCGRYLNQNSGITSTLDVRFISDPKVYKNGSFWKYLSEFSGELIIPNFEDLIHIEIDSWFKNKGSNVVYLNGVMWQQGEEYYAISTLGKYEIEVKDGSLSNVPQRIEFELKQGQYIPFEGSQATITDIVQRIVPETVWNHPDFRDKYGRQQADLYIDIVNALKPEIGFEGWTGQNSWSVEGSSKWIGNTPAIRQQYIEIDVPGLWTNMYSSHAMALRIRRIADPTLKVGSDSRALSEWGSTINVPAEATATLHVDPVFSDGNYAANYISKNGEMIGSQNTSYNLYTSGVYSFYGTAGFSYAGHAPYNGTQFEVVFNNNISVSSNNTDWGTVSGENGYSIGATATVVATPADQCVFIGWKEGDNIVSTDATYTFTISNSRNLVAVFERIICVRDEIITLNVEDNTYLMVGEKLQLVVDYGNANTVQRVRWHSYTPALSVDENGMVTAVEAGCGDVMAIIDDACWIYGTKSCFMVVWDSTISYITFDSNEIGADIGDRLGLIARVDNEPITITSSSMQWNSSDPNVVEIEDVSKHQWYPIFTIMLKVKNAGDAVITATIKGTNISASANVHVSGNVSVPRISLNDVTTTLSPNPVKDQLHIALASNASASGVHVEVHTLAGHLLLSKDFNRAEFDVDLSTCPSGVLLVKVFDGEGVEVYKVVKE
jgi:hypothetical protein